MLTKSQISIFTTSVYALNINNIINFNVPACFIPQLLNLTVCTALKRKFAHDSVKIVLNIFINYNMFKFHITSPVSLSYNYGVHRLTHRRTCYELNLLHLKYYVLMHTRHTCIKLNFKKYMAFIVRCLTKINCVEVYHEQIL